MFDGFYHSNEVFSISLFSFSCFWMNLKSDTVQTHTLYNYCSVIWRGLFMCAICACDFSSLPVTQVLQAFFWQLCRAMLWLVQPHILCVKLASVHTCTHKLVCKSHSVLWCIRIMHASSSIHLEKSCSIHNKLGLMHKAILAWEDKILCSFFSFFVWFRRFVQYTVPADGYFKFL